MNDLLHSFAMKHFEAIFGKLNVENQKEFIRMLMAVVHSHRHNKEDGATSIADNKENSNGNNEYSGDSMGIDYSVVRDTMYKYSKQAQRRFFSNPALAFLFAWFAVSSEGLEFIRTKYHDKGEEYLERIYSEMSELKEQALENLSE